MKDIIATIEMVTPFMASQLLMKNAVNRPLNKMRVDFYAQQMREGKWALNGESISVASDGTLLNGQHRLNAIIKADVPVQMLLVRGVDKADFATFDQGKNRSTSDIFNIAGVPNANKISSIVARYIAICNKINFMNSDNVNFAGIKTSTLRLNVPRVVTKQAMLDIYYANSELFHQACDFCVSVLRKWGNIFSTTELGGFYAFVVLEKRHSCDMIEDFLYQLLSNRTDYKCISELHRKVVTSKVGNSKMSSAMRTALFIKTWNAFVTGRDIKILRYNPDTEAKPEIL